jgi:hypothetical protein
VIVNVQIRGLINDKPRSGVTPGGSGYRKYQECKSEIFFHNVSFNYKSIKKKKVKRSRSNLRSNKSGPPGWFLYEIRGYITWFLQISPLLNLLISNYVKMICVLVLTCKRCLTGGAFKRNMIISNLDVLEILFLWLKVILKVSPTNQSQSEEIVEFIPGRNKYFNLIYCKKYMCERISSVTNKLFKIFLSLSFYNYGERLKRSIGRIRNKLKNRLNINVKLPFTITNIKMISITIFLLLL